LNEGSEVDDVHYSTDDQISDLWPGFSHKTSRICVLISALPPRGTARVRPQTIQFTTDEALPNTIWMFSQSAQRTRKNLLITYTSTNSNFDTRNPLRVCAFLHSVQR
jgi:hypothetical protein